MKGLSAIIGVVALSTLPIIAWITHVIYTIHHAMWILLAIGAFIPPVGIIHGIAIWLGYGAA